MAEFEALKQAIIENGLKRGFKLMGEDILEKLDAECLFGCPGGCADGCAWRCANGNLNGSNGNG